MSEQDQNLRAFWAGQGLFFPPVDKAVFNLNVGFVGSNELFHNLKYEVNLFVLTPENWQETLISVRLDFILVESCFITCTGDWENAQSSVENDQSDLSSIIQYAISDDIPVVYWMTLDGDYFPIFKKFARKMKNIFCVDLMAVESFQREGISADYLPVAIQPKIFNPLKWDKNDGDRDFNIIADNLADILSHHDAYKAFLERLSHYKFHLYDSLNNIWKSKTTPLNPFKGNVLGSVGFASRAELVNRAKIFTSFSPSDKTKMTQVRLALEAAACRLPVIHKGTIGDKDMRTSFVLTHETDDEFFAEIVRMQEDPLYMERVGHKAWRYVIDNHTISHRVVSICDMLLISCEWKRYPKVSMITPTMRPQFIPRTIQQFDQQSYPEKEIVLVVNSNFIDYQKLANDYNHRNDIQVHFLPKEKNAGACMNLGISHATGEYVFRFDDDDFYGPHYIGDYMLYCKAVDADIIGKPARYWIKNEEKFCNLRKLTNAKYCTIFSSKHLGHDKIPISGNSIGGKKEVFLNVIIPDTYRVADTAFHLKVNCMNYKCITTDKFNMVFWRRENSEHTWHWSQSNSLEESLSWLTLEDLYC